jgi:hypothetical protein
LAVALVSGGKYSFKSRMCTGLSETANEKE